MVSIWLVLLSYTPIVSFALNIYITHWIHYTSNSSLGNYLTSLVQLHIRLHIKNLYKSLCSFTSIYCISNPILDKYITSYTILLSLQKLSNLYSKGTHSTKSINETINSAKQKVLKGNWSFLTNCECVNCVSLNANTWILLTKRLNPQILGGTEGIEIVTLWTKVKNAHC